jgi:hypothetical protein
MSSLYIDSIITYTKPLDLYDAYNTGANFYSNGDKYFLGGYGNWFEGSYKF